MRKFIYLLICFIFFNCLTSSALKENEYSSEKDVRTALNKEEEKKEPEIADVQPQIIYETKIEYKDKFIEIPFQEFVIDNIGVGEKKTMKDKSALIKNNVTNNTVGLSDGNFQHAEVVYKYKNGIIYPVHTATQRVTVIELEQGEMLDSYLTGDNLSWVLNNEIIHNKVNIYVMPIKNNVATNFIINTNRRRYIINLIENCNYMPVVKWNYGLDLSKQPILSESEKRDISINANISDQNVKLISESQKGYVDDGVNYTREKDLVLLERLKNINFEWKLKYYSNRNYKPKWYPEKVFDDGFRTYIFVPGLSKISIRPVIFATDKKGKIFKVVNYFVSGLYYIINSVEPQFVLTTEKDNKYENVYIQKK